MKFDHKKFVQDVRTTTGCDHEQAFEVLGLVVELTQLAFIQGASAAMNGLPTPSLALEEVDWFNQAYARACVSSQPDDWRHAGLAGRQLVEELGRLGVVQDDFENIYKQALRRKEAEV